jgi:hypothetical protein
MEADAVRYCPSSRSAGCRDDGGSGAGDQPVEFVLPEEAARESRIGSGMNKSFRPAEEKPAYGASPW